MIEYAGWMCMRVRVCACVCVWCFEWLFVLLVLCVRVAESACPPVESDEDRQSGGVRREDGEMAREGGNFDEPNNL